MLRQKPKRVKFKTELELEMELELEIVEPFHITSFVSLVHLFSLNIVVLLL